MANTLLTGGSGFIGSHFHNYLDQDHLINMDLLAPQFSHRARFVQGDLRKKEDVARAVGGNGITRIISLAAKHHDFGIGHDEYFDTNEDGTRVLCSVAGEHGIKEIIFYSSVAVYGSTTKEATTEETLPLPQNPYGASKLAGEKVLAQWAAEDPSRRVLIIRPVVVFGPNNVANMYSLIRQIDSGIYFHLGKADNIKSIAYVENLVQATLFLAERLKPGVSVYNYADEPQLTTRQISEEIARKLGRKIRITVPMTFALIMGLPFDLAIKVTGKNLPISTARIRKLGTQTLHSGRKVFSEGFKPRFTTIDGLHKMVDWYKNL